MNTYRERLLFVVGVLLAAAAHVAFAQSMPAGQDAADLEQRLPVSAFAALPEMRSPRLSPDGKRLLYLRPVEDTYHTVVIDLEKSSSALVMASDPDEFLINWCRWANNSRIVCSIRYYAELRAGQIDARVVRSYREGRTTFTRLLALNADGSEQLQLVPPPSRRSGGDAQWNAVDQDDVVSWLPDEPEHILIALAREERTKPSVYRLNIYTNRMKQIRRHDDHVLAWYADRQGRLRFATGYDELDPVAFTVNDKKRLQPVDLSAIASDITPSVAGLSGDGKHIYFRSYHDGGTRKLFAVPTSGELIPELVFEPESHDFFGGLFFHPLTGRPLVAQYYTETSVRHWFDEETERSVDPAIRALEHVHRDVSLVSFDDSLNRYVLSGEGDGSLPTFYFFDAGQKDLKRLIADLSAAAVSSGSRGARISRPGTTPPSLPIWHNLKERDHSQLMLLPHGGPHSRDYPTFDYWTAMLVNRGYAVLKVNFRGSIGYGSTHLRQGYNQWGLRMQDDVMDGLAWLIAEGVADPDRVCVVGGSYGGYVALVAAFKASARIRCAVSFAGVTDLGQLKELWRNFNLGELSMERIQDGAAMRENSPLQQVQRIDVPLLIVHGELDRSVMIEQSAGLVEALEKHGKTYRYIYQPGGDHFLSRYSHRLEFLEALDEFLAEHLE